MNPELTMASEFYSLTFNVLLYFVKPPDMVFIPERVSRTLTDLQTENYA